MRRAAPGAAAGLRMAADKEDGGGTDKFEKLNARLDGLAKAADGYKGSEVEDLAEGLADDVADLKKRFVLALIKDLVYPLQRESPSKIYDEIAENPAGRARLQQATHT
jgi:hypothetical protein